MSLIYEPVPSVTPFLLSNKFQSFICGPVGSTKTTAGLIKVLLEAKRVAACPDGVRRSRTAIVRNTRQMLLDSTIPDWLKLFPEGEAGVYHRTELKFVLKVDDIECEVLFRGLDDSSDVRRLLSLQLTNAMMDEVREINPDVFNALTGRLGRYPNGMMVPHRPEWGLDDKGNPIRGCVDDAGNPMKRIWGSTNPADSDSFWETYLSNPPENCHVTIQPSGRTPEADWLQHLPSMYYEDMMQGKTEDWISVYVDGQWGKSLSGQPVFKSFTKDTHVAKTPLNVIVSVNNPIIIGVDAGLTPAAVLGQVIPDGRLLIHNALVSEGMGALRFIREKLKPLLANKFPGHPVLIIIDPAAFQRAQTDERTVADMYKAEGFSVRPAKTNALAARLAAVDNYLTRTVNGKAGVLMDGEGAQPLIQALAGKYRYKINTKGEKDESPEKSHPWSDVCFIAGTPIATPTGYVTVESLAVGDAILTHDGVDVVVGTGSHMPVSLLELTLSDGTVLTCTPDHPFAVNSHTCFLPADALTCKHSLVHVGEHLWESGQCNTQPSVASYARARTAVPSSRFQRGAWRRVKGAIARAAATAISRALEMDWNSTVYGLPAQARTSISGINDQTRQLCLSTVMYGRSTTDQYLLGMSCTTSTTTLATTPRITSLYSLEATTPDITSRSALRQVLSTLLSRLRWPGKRLKPGIGHRKGASGTGSTLTVASSRVVAPQPVFNLTTERTHMYYAGPALVHNCDAYQYLCLHAGGGALFGAATSGGRRVVKPAPSRWAA